MAKEEKTKFYQLYLPIIILIISLFISIIYIQLKKNPETKTKLNPETKTKLNLETKPKIIVEKIDVDNTIIKKHDQELVNNLKDVNKKIYDFLSLTLYYDKLMTRILKKK